MATPKAARKGVLITGASGVIGAAIARRLAKSGFDLYLTSRDIAKLKPLQDELVRSGTKVNVLILDLADTEHAEGVARQFAEKDPAPFGMICNAGNLGILGSFLDVDFKRWQASFVENCLSHAAMIRAFANSLRRRNLHEGAIVTLSGAGLGGDAAFANMTAYSTAKAALTHLAEALAPELLPFNITINAISPGPVLSGLTEETIAAGAARAGSHAAAAQKCKESGGVSPDLAAQLVEFLLSPKARHLTGRLLSARWDQDRLRSGVEKIQSDPNLFRLRRIDGDLFRPTRSES